MPETFSGTLTGSSGSKLTITAAELTPVAPPAPKPDPVPPAPNPPTGIGRQRVLWHFGWKAQPLAALPPDVRSSLTVVSCAMSQSAGSGTGRLTTPPGVTKAEVASLVADGIDVLMCVGGSGDGGIRVVDSTQAQQAVDSWKRARDSFGYTGLDSDLEGSSGTWTQSAWLEMARGIIAEGGKIAVTSSLWGGRLENWGGVCHALGDDLLYWSRMFYDFPEAADGRLNGIVAGDLPKMRKYLSRDSQLVAGFMPRPPGESYPNASPDGVIPSAYRAARSVYALAGWAVWEDYIDQRLGWKTVRSLAAL